MALVVPGAIYPSERRSLGIARETTPGTGVAPTSTIPVKGFVPENKPIWLPDESLRSSMAQTYGLIEGPYVADITIEASPVYADTIGNILYNVLGDMTESGTEVGSVTTTINHSGGYPAGTTGAITVASGTAFTSNTYVQIGTGSAAEVVAFSGSASTTITLSGTTRFAHATGVAVTEVAAPFTHIFSLLNGTGSAQPPSHTLTDFDYINSVLSRWYPFSCFSEVTITGNAEQLLMWSGKALGYANAIPGSAPTVAVSAVAASPAWNSTTGIGGTISAAPVYNAMEWEVTLTRQVEPYFTADGSQNPYVIGRGKFSCTGKINFAPAAVQPAPTNYGGDYPLTQMLANTQPQLQILATCGTSLSLQVDALECAFNASVIEPSKALLGYSNGFEAIGNTTNTGQSAGYSPLAITLINAVPTYVT